MRTIKAFIGIRLMMLALRLVSRRDDAHSLRIAIPLTLALIGTMQGVSAKGVAPHVEGLRKALDVRAKLAKLEGSERTPG